MSFSLSMRSNGTHRTGARFASRAVLLVAALAVSACSFSTSTKSPETPASAKDGAGSESGGKKKSAKSDSKPDSKKEKSGDSSKKKAAGDKKGGDQSAVAPAKPKKVPRPKMSAAAKSAFANGQKAFAKGDLQGARTQYAGAVKADSKAYQAHYAAGVVNERLGAQSKAIQSYKAALRIVPDHEPSIVAYSILLARQGNEDAALSLLQKSSAKSGPSAPLLAAKAEVKSIQGRSGEAQELAQQALKVDPSYKPAMVALARDHYRARRIDLALYALTGILDGYGEGNPPRDKKNAEARLMRGLIYSERGMRGPAMEEMELALKVRPDLVDAHLVLATYMMEAGNAKGARVHLEKAIRYDNKNVAAHLQLGDAYRLLDRPGDARRELEWVLAADPNQAAAHYNLGLLFLLSDKIKGMSEMQALDKAIEHLEAYKSRAVRGGPDDVDDLITRAKTKKVILKANQKQGAAG